MEMFSLCVRSKSCFKRFVRPLAGNIILNIAWQCVLQIFRLEKCNFLPWLLVKISIFFHLIGFIVFFYCLFSCCHQLIKFFSKVPNHFFIKMKVAEIVKVFILIAKARSKKRVSVSTGMYSPQPDKCFKIFFSGWWKSGTKLWKSCSVWFITRW